MPEPLSEPVVTKRNYLPQIDGLRAYAVAGVVLYHFKIWPFVGGLFGVDVFFVISGFLITGIVLRSLSNDTFSVADFYRRRARRILPALTVVLVVTGGLGLWLLTPTARDELGKTILSAATFSSNWYFFLQPNSDYFAADAELNPLLHLWSLAVEEQFYLVFPAVLFVVWRSQLRRHLLAVVLGLAFASYTALLLLPGNVTAFYLTPMRVWQLLAGAALAVWFLQRPSQRLPHGTSLGGLVLVCLSLVGIGVEPTRLGPMSLLPVLGAVLVIAGNGLPASLNRALLTGRFWTWLGRISYSVYLWHWPLVALVKRFGVSPYQPLWQLFLIAATVLLGHLSWKYIETPFRERRGWPVLRVAAATLAGTAAFGLALTAIPANASPARDHLLTMQDKHLYYSLYQRGSCFLDLDQSASDYSLTQCVPWLSQNGKAKRVLLIGDSHAAHIYQALSDELRGKAFLAQYTAASCRPIRGDIWQPSRCRKWMDRLFSEVLATARPDVVVVAGNWSTTLKDVSFDELAADLESTFAKLKPARVVLVGQVPGFETPVPDLLYKWGVDDQPLSEQTSTDLTLEQSLASVALSAGVEYVNPARALCEGALCRLGTVDSPYYWDSGHFTLAGARVVAPAIAEKLLN